ncbi:MAG: hypothetical protein HY376_02300, partial [Candidatus Blackburnbacteria bacterium]|nr:hypothetical protein [Candidatus Blackburnbacteria bacterium]
GMGLTILAGYTGAGQTSGFFADNASAGTNGAWNQGDTGYSYRPTGNRGLNGYTRGTTTGVNTGGLYSAGNGSYNFGIFSASTINKSGASNVGVAGFGLNTGGGGGSGIGGFFSLETSISAPIMGSSTVALVADNNSQSADIFSARDNANPVFRIQDTGLVSSTPSTITTAGTNDYIASFDQILNASAGTGGTDNYYGLKLNYTSTTVTGWDGDVWGMVIQVGGNNLYEFGLDPAIDGFTMNDATGGLDIRLNTGAVVFQTQSVANINFGYDNDDIFREVLKLVNTASQVNELQITGSATGGTVALAATGDDQSIGLTLSAKGTDAITFGNLDTFATWSSSTFSFAEGVGMHFRQNTRTSDTAATNTIFSAQDAFASAVTNKDGGDFIFNLSSPASGGNAGNFQVNGSGGNSLFTINDGGSVRIEGQFVTAYDIATDKAATGSTTSTVSLFSQGVGTDSAVTVKGSVNAVLSDGSKVSMFTINAGYRNDGGVLTEVYESNTADFESNSATDVSLAPSGTDIVVSVSGAVGENYTFGLDLDITETGL